jgi:methyl-galactoside transport system substrate-binding protein
MRLRLFSLVLAALFLLAPAAAATVIGVEIYRADDTFMSVMREEMEEAAGGRATLKPTDGKNDQTAQNDWLCRHVAEGVDVLAINAVDPTASSILLEKAQSAGIPVVFFNREPDAADMPERGWYYVGAPAEQSGVMAGELMADYFKKHPEADLNGDGVIQYVLIEGQAGHQDAALRSEYCVKALRDAGFKLSLIASERADWRRDEAKNIMAEWLASYDGIEAVFANNDDMALGAIDALKAAGYFAGGKFLPVVGVDATAAGLEAMREGALMGTVRNDAVNQGRAVVNLALVLARGETPTEENVGYPITDGKYIWIPYEKVTPAG